VSLTTERYDLAMAPDIWGSEPVQALARWLRTAEARHGISALGGYAVDEAGQVRWVG
jgi:molybdate-binding protein